jgi:hypothetical protein
MDLAFFTDAGWDVMEPVSLPCFQFARSAFPMSLSGWPRTDAGQFHSFHTTYNLPSTLLPDSAYRRNYISPYRLVHPSA